MDASTVTKDKGHAVQENAALGFVALVIPVDGPVQTIRLGNDGDALSTLQAAVGGFIEAVPLPDFIKGSDRATCYVNEEGKYTPECQYNPRGTDFMVPGVGLMWGDYIAGSLVVAGFDPETGSNADLPEPVAARVRLIEREAGLGGEAA